VIPGNRLSSQPRPAPLLLDNPQPTLRESRHRGGVALNDASQGLDVRTWVCRTDGTAVTLEAAGVPATTLFTGTGITEVSLAFDQNMNPFVAFVDSSGPRFRWFDPVVSQYVITALPAGSTNPRACLDDNRGTQSAASDVIIAYVRAAVLHFRAQRDRYLVEYTLSTGLFRPLRAVGMNRGLRLQFQLGDTPA